MFKILDYFLLFSLEIFFVLESRLIQSSGGVNGGICMVPEIDTKLRSLRMTLLIKVTFWWTRIYKVLKNFEKFLSPRLHKLPFHPSLPLYIIELFLG